MKFRWFIVIFIILLDQFTKGLVKQNFQLGESRQVLGELFRLTYIHNLGGAFGVKLGTPFFYLVTSLVIIVIVFFYLWRSRRLSAGAQVAFALILGGAIGNLVDRLFYRQVVDFFDFDFPDIDIPSFTLWFWHFPGYALDRWPVFNIADAAVTCGILLLLFATLFEPKSKQPAGCETSVWSNAITG